MSVTWARLAEVFIVKTLIKNILLIYFLSCFPNLAKLGHAATQPTVLDLNTAIDESEANQSQAFDEARRARRRYSMSPLQRLPNALQIFTAFNCAHFPL